MAVSKAKRASDPFAALEHLMQEPAEPTEETKHSRGFGRYVLWAGVVLLVYVLSVGPVWMMAFNGSKKCRVLIDTLYEPLAWTCRHTLLSKPMNMYLALWVPPDRYGK